MRKQDMMDRINEINRSARRALLDNDLQYLMRGEFIAPMYAIYRDEFFEPATGLSQKSSAAEVYSFAQRDSEMSDIMRDLFEIQRVATAISRPATIPGKSISKISSQGLVLTFGASLIQVRTNVVAPSINAVIACMLGEVRPDLSFAKDSFEVICSAHFLKRFLNLEIAYCTLIDRPIDGFRDRWLQMNKMLKELGVPKFGCSDGSLLLF